jgi:hypothetical protein
VFNSLKGSNNRAYCPSSTHTNVFIVTAMFCCTLHCTSFWACTFAYHVTFSILLAVLSLWDGGVRYRDQKRDLQILVDRLWVQACTSSPSAHAPHSTGSAGPGQKDVIAAPGCKQWPMWLKEWCACYRHCFNSRSTSALCMVFFHSSARNPKGMMPYFDGYTTIIEINIIMLFLNSARNSTTQDH